MRAKSDEASSVYPSNVESRVNDAWAFRITVSTVSGIRIRHPKQPQTDVEPSQMKTGVHVCTPMGKKYCYRPLETRPEYIIMAHGVVIGIIYSVEKYLFCNPKSLPRLVNTDPLAHEKRCQMYNTRMTSQCLARREILSSSVCSFFVNTTNYLRSAALTREASHLSIPTRSLLPRNGQRDDLSVYFTLSGCAAGDRLARNKLSP